MRVTFCGTGAGGSVNPRRGNSSLHLAVDGFAALLDTGPGFMERMAAASLDPNAVRAVLFSHLHFDHAVGIIELLTRTIIHTGPPPRAYGPRGTDEYVASALAFARLNATRPENHQWLDGVSVELTRPGDDREIGPFAVESREVPHVEYLECLARRIRCGGRTLVYTGDTTSAPDVLVPLAEGADLLIHEAFTESALRRTAEAGAMPGARAEAFFAAIRSTHSSAAEAGRIAREAGVRRLVLTHLLAAEREDELIAEAGREFGGEVLVAADGMALEV